MKHLPKHLRPRWRYLAVGIESPPEAEIGRGAVQRQLWEAARSLIGDTGSASVDLRVLSFEHADGYGEAVVRVRRGEADRGRAIVATVDRIEGDPVGLVVRGVSGTVRACEEKYMGRRPEEPEQRHVVFRDVERTALVAGDRAAVRTEEAFVGATTLDLH